MADTENSIENEGIPEITLSVTALSTTTNAVDPTLRNAGEAADAKAAGDAIRAVESTVEGLNATTLYMDGITQTSANSIATAISAAAARTGDDINMADDDTRKIATVVGAIEGWTGEDINIGESDTRKVGTVLAAVEAKTGADINISSTDTRKIGTVLATVEGYTGADLAVSGTDARKMGTVLTTVEGRTAVDITYDSAASGTGNNVKSVVDGLETRMTTAEATHVSVNAQELTVDQKTQARTNLGLGTGSQYNVAANLTTESTGSYVLDAKMGKDLKDSIDTLSAQVSASGFTTGEVTSTSFSVSAGEANTSISIEVPAVSGYRAAGVVGWRLSGSSCSWLHVYRLSLDTDEESNTQVVSAGVRNVSSSANASSVTLTAIVLYIR